MASFSRTNSRSRSSMRARTEPRSPALPAFSMAKARARSASPPTRRGAVVHWSHRARSRYIRPQVSDTCPLQPMRSKTSSLLIDRLRKLRQIAATHLPAALREPLNSPSGCHKANWPVPATATSTFPSSSLNRWRATKRRSASTWLPTLFATRRCGVRSPPAAWLPPAG